MQESKPIHRNEHWGESQLLEAGPQYCINIVTIQPGGQMTLHLHYHRSEHWVVMQGTVLLVCEEQETLVCMGQSSYVPPCTPHRLVNPGVVPARLVEVQNGEYLGDDDVIVLDTTLYAPLLR